MMGALVTDLLPDAEITVLMRLCGDEYPVWPGFHDGDKWRSADGSTVEGPVRGWCDLDTAAAAIDAGMIGVEGNILPGEKPQCDMVAYLAEQRDWSSKTFGPGSRMRGIVEHVGKELAEVTAARTPQESLEEWCDIAILALDGAWRAGFTPEQVCEQLHRKATINRARQWPPPGSQDRANEHVRSHA